MSSRISKIGKLAGVWLAASLATATAKTGGAYLPVTGPTPLRLEVTPARTFDFSSVGKVAAAPMKSEVSPQAGEPAPASTNAPHTIVSVTESNGSVLAVVLPGAAPEEPTPPAPPHPADNLLVITPQMLAEYFRPVSNSTNGAGVSVFLPVSVGFTPPTDKNPPSSRATYKVQ